MVNNNTIQRTFLQEASVLRAIQHNTVIPLEQYYFQQEAKLCDVPDIIHKQQHDYGTPRHRSIDLLTEYEALHFTNFTKSQLRRIYRCFNFGYDWIRLHCSQGNFYRECQEHIFLFGLVKTSSGLDNLALCALYFGGSPRRMSNAFK